MNVEEMDALNAYHYARDVIQGRWKQGEKIIAADAHFAYKYAKDVIKGRWIEAEPTIAKDAGQACWYGLNVINGRWPEAEQVIAKHITYKQWYLEGCFPNQAVVTKDEVDEIEWSRLGLQGYFANAELFQPRKSSLLDMMIE
jgi:hypothetical protein